MITALRPVGDAVFSYAEATFDPVLVRAKLRMEEQVDQYCAVCGNNVIGESGEMFGVAFCVDVQQIDKSVDLIVKSYDKPYTLKKDRTQYVCKSCTQQHDAFDLSVALLAECNDPMLCEVDE